ARLAFVDIGHVGPLISCGFTYTHIGSAWQPSATAGFFFRYRGCATAVPYSLQQVHCGETSLAAAKLA
ncbi:hypothetical protein HAX54_028513, partial [Datura stramonium]|nr:hypothetical protein [Datura stramonium]